MYGLVEHISKIQDRMITGRTLRWFSIDYLRRAIVWNTKGWEIFVFYLLLFSALWYRILPLSNLLSTENKVLRRSYFPWCSHLHGSVNIIEPFSIFLTAYMEKWLTSFDWEILFSMDSKGFPNQTPVYIGMLGLGLNIHEL